MNKWSPTARQRRLHRRAVPDGSFDFQRVLDELLSSDDNVAANGISNHHEEGNEGTDILEWADGERYRYEDDFEYDDEKHDAYSGAGNYDAGYNVTSQAEPNNNNDHNNNGNSCTCACGVQECQRRVPRTGKNIRDVISPSGVVIVDCFGSSLTDTESQERSGPTLLKLPSISPSKMGTSCSSNMYDRRDWHNVGEGSNTELNKPTKRGRLLKKRSPEDEKGVETSPVPIVVCTCQRLQESYAAQEGTSPMLCGSDKRSTLSPTDITETSGTQLTSNRLSPNVDSSGHVKVSRVVGSGRARATSSCDVSPHRLLTRRNNSPKGRTTSLEAHCGVTSQDLRQRSYSWSNGKIGNKTTYRSLTLTNRATMSPPMGNHKTLPPQITSNGPKSSGTKVSRISTAGVTTLPQCSTIPVAIRTHDPSCPLYKTPDGATNVSDMKTPSLTFDNVDDDLAPMTRRRAASESQTGRPRRLLPRTPDSIDHGHSPEHAHVHWADEEKGCSLSTCVFLSSIRPRSYSHGAMDNMPHRPILKKVTGF